MTETENYTIRLRLLQEIRTDISSLRIEVGQFKTETKEWQTGTTKKLDRLTVELAGVRGRIRKVEELNESMARLVSGIISREDA